MQRRIAALCAAGLTIGLSVAVATGPAAAEPVEPDDTGAMMLVLDASGSMAEKVSGGGTKIDAARSALDTVIDRLPQEQPVGLRVYGATVFDRSEPGACTDSQQVVALGTDNRDELRAAVADYKPYGETPIGHALREAAEDLGDEGRRTIVLVSDGEPTCDPDPCKVAARLTRQGFDLKVDVVGLDVRGQARSKLRCIADRGNGTYYDADSAEDLVETLVTAQTRASRPFDLTGEPVVGTPTPDSAPTIGDGQWLDTVPAGDGSLWYRIDRTAPGSTIHVGIAHLASGDANIGESATVALFDGPGGTRCTSASSFGRLDALGHAGTHTAAAGPGDCDGASAVYVEVSLALDFAEAAGDPIEIAVYEEPPIVGLAKPREQPGPHAWTTLEPGTPDRSVRPGTAVSNAPVVSDGTYGLDINPGETQVLAIPLDWGQDLQAQFDGEVTRTRQAAAREQPDIRIVGPLRQRVGGGPTDQALGDDWTTSLPFDRTSAYRWGRQSFPVAPDNRFAIADAWAGSSLPGLRYVVVSLPERAPAPVEYMLTLRTNGTAGDGAPQYEEVEGLTPPRADSRLVTADGREDTGAAADPAEEPSEAPTTAAPADADSADGGLPWLPIGLGAAVVVGLAAGAAVVARRRRA